MWRPAFCGAWLIVKINQRTETYIFLAQAHSQHFFHFEVILRESGSQHQDLRPNYVQKQR